MDGLYHRPVDPPSRDSVLLKLKLAAGILSSMREIVRIAGHPIPTDIDYSQRRETDNNRCFSSLIAYMMFRIGASDELWEPEHIDILTGRIPGEPTYDKAAGYVALMEQGARLTNISDMNDQRIVDEGFPYLEEFYANSPWMRDHEAAFYAYWTDQRVEDYRRSRGNLITRGRELGRLHSEARPPTLYDVQTIPDETSAVILDMEHPNPDVVHLRIALGYISTADKAPPGYGPGYVVFDNDEAEYTSPLTIMSPEDFEPLFRPDFGAMAVHWQA